MKFIQTINSSANKLAKGIVGIFAIKLLLFGGAFLIQSCQTDEIEDTQTIEQELLDYVNSSSFKQLEINFPNLVRGLDYETFTLIKENDITVYSVKSRSNNLSLGSLFFLKNINDEYKTIVETYTHDNNLNIKTASYDNVYRNNIFSLDVKKIDAQTYSLKLNKEISRQLNKESFSQTEERSWWSCTRGCVGDAWGACADDNECDFLCAVAGGYLGCAASIATGCAAWCLMDSDNDLTPDNK